MGARACAAAAVAQTEAERLTQRAYDALMWALARPGEIRMLPESGFLAAGRCLLDLEVGFFTTDEALAAALAATGARLRPPDEADYLFCPRIDAAALRELALARRGDPLYPDRAATLFVGADLDGREGLRMRLSGPGIADRREIRVGGVDEPTFWAKRRTACRYPLGWDIFLIDGTQVLGLPRSTLIEVL